MDAAIFEKVGITMALYRSPWEAYPFLCDDSENLCCDFELLTDEIASLIGLLAAKSGEFCTELLRIAELVYHANPTLRTHWSITDDEIDWLYRRTEALADESKAKKLCGRFVLPQGCESACIAHLLRVKAKELVRLIYRHVQQGHCVPSALLDFSNLLSGYFFNLALILNDHCGTAEIDYQSRNY